MVASNSALTSRSHKVLSNIAAQALSRMVTMAVSFALLPFVISRVGREAYGLYVLVLTVTGYFTLLDFGVFPAIVKYVAEYHSRGDHDRFRRILNSAFTFYVGVGGFVALALVAASLFADRLFHLAPATAILSRQLFVVAAVAALTLWPTTVFRAVMEGLQRYDVSAFVNASAQVAGAIGVITALALGGGVLAVLLLMNASTLAANLTFYACVRRWDPQFRLTFPVRDRDTSRLIFSFSTYLFVGSLTSLVIFQLDHLIVGTMISVSAVTSFSVAYTLHAGIKSLDNLIAGPPWAASADLEGRRDYAAQQRLLVRGTRYIALFFLPIVLITIVFAAPLIRYWMGPEFRESVLPGQILLASWLLFSLYETGVAIMTSKGLVKIPTLLAVIHAALHLGLALLLVRPLGIVGVALGTTIPGLLIWFPTMAYVLRKLEMRFVDFAREALRDAAIPLASSVALAVGTINFWYPPNLAWTLLEMAGLYASVFGVAYACSLDVEDRLLIRHLPSLCANLVLRRA